MGYLRLRLRARLTQGLLTIFRLPGSTWRPTLPGTSFHGEERIASGYVHSCAGPVPARQRPVAMPFELTPRISSDARPGRIVRILRASTVVAATVLVAALAYQAVGTVLMVLRDHAETNRTTARFDPPVWAGQLLPVPCGNGGFYARDQDSIVLTISAHCGVAVPGSPWHDADGRLIGTFGPAAQLPDCPDERFCAPSDFVKFELAPDRIPWGHLNLVDLGAGGYRTIAQGMRPLSCADVEEGDAVEVNGREHFRTGTVIAIGPYEYESDTMFPCMVISDVHGQHGDSGGAVLVDGQPAGVTARVISGYLAFTPLAEGLANLGLTLCTTPDCDLTPPAS
jgi:hypothetical protein